MPLPVVLTVGGNDPDGCAGIAADLRTFFSLGVHGCSVITAATSQNTQGYSGSFAISPQSITSQLDSVFSDLRVDAVKIGFITGEGNVEAVANSLRKWKAKNVVLDPVMSSQPGSAQMVSNRTLGAIKKHLVPFCTFITPNAFEAAALTGIHEPKKAARKLVRMGACNTVVTGVRKGRMISDYAIIRGKPFTFSKQLLRTATHGGGCVFSSALAVGLAKGANARKALEDAEATISSSIANAWKPGKGLATVEPLGSKQGQTVLAELAVALATFEAEPSAWRILPEVGTNLVYSLPRAKSTKDVAGVVGRIRRSGNAAQSLGRIEFGTSSHAARMLLEFSKHFRSARAALNMAKTPVIERACKRLRFRTVLADRSLEPRRVAGKENRSMDWLVRNATKGMRTMPDAILFTGSIGKEPSTVLFGRTPSEVVRKAIKLSRSL